MKSRLNGWQRLWVVLSILMVFPLAFLQIAIWPYSSNDTLQELRSPACKAFREVPDGFFLEEYPALDSDCYNLQVLSYERITVRSVKDYENHLLSSRIKAIAIVLGIWISLSFTLYAFGWSIRWIIQGFRKS